MKININYYLIKIILISTQYHSVTCKNRSHEPFTQVITRGSLTKFKVSLFPIKTVTLDKDLKIIA